MTLYDILEVSPNASPAVIRAAYKSLMQRYHPDKNPGDSTMAEQASRVVQAYEVLSDPDKRAAYDRDLRQQQRQDQRQPQGGASDGRSAQPGSSVSRNAARSTVPLSSRATPGQKAAAWLPPGPARWLALCALLLALAMVAVALRNKKPAAPPDTAVVNASAAPAPAAANGTPAAAPSSPDSLAGPPQSLEIPAYLRRLTIPLKNPQRPEEATGHVLYIPVITIKVGSLDSASAIKHLNNTAEQITTKLQDSLALSPLEALNPVDGDAYLARSILSAINTTIGTTTPEKPATAIPGGPNPPQEGARYGVVEVSLPERFSVR